MTSCGIAFGSRPAKGPSWLPSGFGKWSKRRGEASPSISSRTTWTIGTGAIRKPTGSSFVDAGVPNHKIITVSIAGDKWDGINAVRDRLPRMWFDLACETPQADEYGDKLPSGVGCLSNYRTQPKPQAGPFVPYHCTTSIHTGQMR